MEFLLPNRSKNTYLNEPRTALQLPQARREVRVRAASGATEKKEDKKIGNLMAVRE